MVPHCMASESNTPLPALFQRDLNFECGATSSSGAPQGVQICDIEAAKSPQHGSRQPLQLQANAFETPSPSVSSTAAQIKADSRLAI